jgi:DNA-binding response OmpR family regulator
MAVFAKLGIRDVDPEVATWIRTVIIMVVLAAVLTLTHEWTNLLAFSGRSWLFFTLSSLSGAAPLHEPRTSVMHVLIIEDNPDIVANLYAFLEPLGYVLDCARNGPAGLEAARTGTHDAIVLDLSLPGLDGVELCRRLRRELRKATPVLMLTARDTIQDKVVGFESGADDYLVKPFLLAELDLRLKALVRRARSAHVATVWQVGDLSFDTAALTVTRAGRRIELTPTGYKLLARLMQADGGLVSRAALEREVWEDDPPDSDALRTHIHALRRAIDKPFNVPLLKTVPGLGYRLEAEIHPTEAPSDEA